MNGVSNPMRSTDGLAAVEAFIQCAPGCQGMDVLLRRFMNVIEATNLVDQLIVVLVNSDDPESRLWISSGIEQPQLEDLLTAMYASLIDGSCADVTIPMLSGISKSIDINIDADHGTRIGLFARCTGKFESNVQYVERILRLLVNVLKLSIGRISPSASGFPILQNIINAKHQWEATVDNLDDLICLLDENGLVVRANKTLETWGLGSVALVKGVSVHDMLHPDCSDKQCSLRNIWEDMWHTSMRSRFELCEFFDHFWQRDIRLSVRRRDCETSKELEMENFSILVAEDISGSKWEERLVEDYNEEMYRKVQTQTGQLDKVSADLKWERSNNIKISQVLKRSESIRQTLSAQLLKAQEEERKRIAGELHDGIGQSIGAIKFGLEHMLIAADRSDPQLDKASIRMAVNRLQLAVEEIRRISMGLRPSMLDDLGLTATLRWLCGEFQSLHKNIVLDKEFDVEEKHLTEIQVDMIFRIIQEALNNISKHSQARSASMRLTSNQKRLILEIKDDGVGFDWKAGPHGGGFGLNSMRERAKLSGGIISMNRPGYSGGPLV